MGHLTYESALNYLNSFIDYEKKSVDFYTRHEFKLDRMFHLLKSLGNPHNKLDCIHVAGSKGKGSTCAMIDSILRAGGYKVGLYTSPHLVSPRERFRINFVPISKEQFTDLVARIQPHIDSVQRKTEGKPSFFEIFTAMAFCYFSEQDVDFVVLEVGLGGRLDATNVIENPLLSVITPISIDHTKILGDTIPEIAREKAGIIKQNGRVVLAPQTSEAQAVFNEVCSQHNATCHHVENDQIERIDWNEEGQRVKIAVRRSGGSVPAYELFIPLLGAHQALNAATAVASIKVLKDAGYTLPIDQVISGLRQTRWPGRMQIIAQNPTVLVDCAHTPASASALREAISEIFDYRKLIAIVSLMGDKDISGFGRELCQIVDHVICTKVSNNPRVAEPDELKQEWKSLVDEIDVVPDVSKALEMGQEAANQNDLICVAGSCYLVGEVLEQKHGHQYLR